MSVNFCNVNLNMNAIEFSLQKNFKNDIRKKFKKLII